MNTRPLLFGALVYVGIKAFAKIDAVQKFHYDINGMPSVSIESGMGIVTVPLLITNSTGERFSIRNIYAKLTVNGSFIGDVSNDAKFTIDPYGRGTVTLSLSIFVTNAVITLISTLASKSKGLTVGLAGSVVTDTVSVPLSISKKVA